MTFLKGQNPQGGFARRVVVGGIAGAGAVLAAGLYRFTDLFVKHYPPTPYDDLLGQLTDREQAIRLGKAALQHPHGDMAYSNDEFAKFARRRLGAHELRAAAEQDVLHGDIVEIEGWILPLTIALLSTLAASIETGSPGLPDRV